MKKYPRYFLFPPENRTIRRIKKKGEIVEILYDDGRIDSSPLSETGIESDISFREAPIKELVLTDFPIHLFNNK